MAPPSYLKVFIHEVEDLLERIEAAILALESSPDDAELINQLFRAFHTLKGSAGVAGVGSIATFTHHVESAMDRVRSGAVALTPALVSVVLASKDHVAALLAAELGNPAPPRETGPALVAQLEALTGAGQLPAHEPRASRNPEPDGARFAGEPSVDYLVVFTPGDDASVFADLDHEALVMSLLSLGACSVLAPPTVALGPDGTIPAWRFLVTTNQGEDAIHDVFIFFAGAGELAVSRGLSLFAPEVAAVEDRADNHASAAPPVAPSAGAASAPSSKTAAAAAPRRPGASSADSTVRVSSARLDQLVKLIGELVITQSRLQQAHSLHPTPELAAPVESFERLIAELRDGVLGLRMVPIGTMFARFHRLIRDLSAELDKEVDLVTAGDDTELDKTVIDQLGDAILHILRNSLDHGFESPDERAAAGKPRRGTLRLTAAHQGTHVVITIADDGRGIDLAAVRRKAEQQGLIAPGEQLSEQDTIALVTRPGFSTAKQVTQLSGRGVGMDVVKKTVEGMRGALAISSRVEAGTEVRLKLPLTLAIIDGLLVEIDRDRFIVPLAAVTENLELTAADRAANNGRNVVALRGELVPYVRLRDVFHIESSVHELEKVVVVAIDGERVGLVVDRVIGSHQTVIQPLGEFFRGVDLFSGTTIMGDGRVAMILDLASAVRASAAGAPSRTTAASPPS